MSKFFYFSIEKFKEESFGKVKRKVINKKKYNGLKNQRIETKEPIRLVRKSVVLNF
ncbi:hypothetical protein BGP_5367 [Beggiatoa sp. PS]|nr:hypothetical protein BGP_5367 [Beggiatoa sp. PS]